MEYCILGSDVTIGERCIVSNVHLISGTSVPDGSFLHTVPLSVSGEVCYTTFAFGKLAWNIVINSGEGWGGEGELLVLSFIFNAHRIKINI